MLYIAVVLLGFSERAAWSKTPYQIIKLFDYHKEYNQQQFGTQQGASNQSIEQLDEIDIALGGM